jgi:rubrerythrin
MNFLTSLLHLAGSGATAYILARNLRDPLTRPNTLAGFQLAESGSVPFLEALSQRASKEGDNWLAEKLSIHAADECRHGQIFAHGLKQLGKEVINFKNLNENKSKQDRRSPFFESYFEGYSQEDFKPENIDWIVFMGSTYILELDASKDFARMANVLPEDEAIDRNLKKGILSIAADETRHAAYLREAMERRLSTKEVETIIDQWRTRKVNATWAMVGNFIQKGGQTNNFVQDGAPTEIDETVPELAAV